MPYFKSHLVRALAWSCFSETLINEIAAPDGAINRPNLPLTSSRLDWLEKLDANDLALKKYLHQHCHSRRLGLVFESFWHFFLLEDPDTELVAHNIPVRDGKVTLGEFDLIYYCRISKRHIHLELAVKFFLGIPNKHKTPDMDEWFGPNRADRLDRKLARLTQHQLPLAQTEAGLAVIAQLGIDCIDQELQVGGILFHANIEDAHTLPLNPHHQRGDWLTTSTFQVAQSQSGKQGNWRYIEKPNWLGAEFNTATLLTDKHLLMATHKPIMLINAQQQRRFLVADDWAD